MNDLHNLPTPEIPSTIQNLSGRYLIIFNNFPVLVNNWSASYNSQNSSGYLNHESMASPHILASHSSEILILNATTSNLPDKLFQSRHNLSHRSQNNLLHSPFSWMYFELSRNRILYWSSKGDDRNRFFARLVWKKRSIKPGGKRLRLTVLSKVLSHFFLSYYGHNQRILSITIWIAI